VARRAAAREDQFARLAPHYDALMAPVPYQAWADYISDLALLAQRPIMEGTRLLDLATGTGSVALEFAARGCEVTGLDLSEPMLVEARRKAEQRGLRAELVQADLSDFRLPRQYNHAVCLYDSLNYLLEPELLERAFANVRAALVPTGLFIFDVNTVHALEAELFTQTSPTNAAVRYRWVSKYDRRKCITEVEMHFEVAQTGEVFDIVHYQRAYTDAELRSLLHRAGLDVLLTFAAYRLTAPTVTSDRVFYVAAPRATAEEP
jgi:ubiquinone/menaquinone biosynthesis C-methylase UbiE